MNNLSLNGYYTLTAKDKNGKTLWQETVKNLVLDNGRQQTLDIALASTAKPTWRLGLSTTSGSITGTTTITGEVGTRQTVTFVRSAFVATSSEATFTNIDATVNRVFLTSESSGTSAFSMMNLNGPRVLTPTDTLMVVYQVSA